MVLNGTVCLHAHALQGIQVAPHQPLLAAISSRAPQSCAKIASNHPHSFNKLFSNSSPHYATVGLDGDAKRHLPPGLTTAISSYHTCPRRTSNAPKSYPPSLSVRAIPGEIGANALLALSLPLPLSLLHACWVRGPHPTPLLLPGLRRRCGCGCGWFGPRLDKPLKLLLGKLELLVAAALRFFSFLSLLLRPLRITAAASGGGRGDGRGSNMRMFGALRRWS